MSGERWIPTDLFRQYANHLSDAVHFSARDKILTLYIMRRLSYFFNKTQLLNQEMNTKEARDQLLTIGMSCRKLRRIDRGTKKMLIAKYRYDICKLSALTNLDFTDWLA
jgi:hypothetical protein